MRLLDDRAGGGMAALALAILAAAGCAEERPPLPGAGQETTTSAPPAPPPSAGVETGVDLPLKLTGIGSKAELDRELTRISDPAIQSEFERGFRGSFVTDRSKRRYDTALAAMEKVLQAMPEFPPAYRVIANARLNTSFDMPGATEMYEKAVAADPEYGEAHYALAFMLTQTDIERGRVHFERAMELGVPDERNLRSNWYPDAAK